MKLNRIAALAALSLSLTWESFGLAQDELPLADWAAEARRQADAPGLGLVVVRNGSKPEIAVDGVRISGQEASVAAQDKWHWGSISKSMTATLAARLVEKGAVAWEDTIGARLGKVAPKMLEAYRDATLQHLLCHRAGLAANIPIGRFADFGQNPGNPIEDRLRWVRLALEQQPVGPKEETYVYSNNGYVVAGAMLESATGQAWESLMQREVFEPLGIADAGFGPPQGAQPRGHRPASGVDRAVPANADNPAALGPAGRVHMSLTDMARYLLAHSQKRKDFLRPETYDLLHSTPYGGIYALGWVKTGPDGRWHNGSNTMWYAEAAIRLTDGSVAAVAVNDGDIRSVQPAVRALLQKLLKKPE